MAEHKLERTGLVPVIFAGELIAEADGRNHAGQERNRWYEIAVYRTQGATFVVQVVYRTIWQGESDYHWVLESAEASNVGTVLLVLGDLQQQYEVLCSQVLDGDEFAERIE
jgi:hypothetical protein